MDADEGTETGSGVMTPLTGTSIARLASARLERLVDDLLDFARLEAGTFALQVREADLAEQFHEIVEILRPQPEDARVALETSVPAEPLKLAMDPQRIGQVLTNLVHNAIKFTPEGGRIEVRARREGTAVVCDVRDTGLGLNISKAIVEAHGGEIGVESSPGRGTTFWFKLPGDRTC